MKLRNVQVRQPGLLVRQPWSFPGYHVDLSAEKGWSDLEGTATGVVARRDGGVWHVPWNAVLCDEREEVAPAVSVPLTASVGAAVAGKAFGKAKKR